MHIVVQVQLLSCSAHPSYTSSPFKQNASPMYPQGSVSLLGSTLAAVTDTGCDNPLVGFADLARLVSSFRLDMELDI